MFSGLIPDHQFTSLIKADIKIKKCKTYMGASRLITKSDICYAGPIYGRQ
jgi:hypothetical protein